MHIQSPSFINNIFIFIQQMKPISDDPNPQDSPQRAKNKQNKSIRHSQQTHHWVGVHIDDKYFLTTPEAFEKLRNLDLQITQQKNKLNGLVCQQQIKPADQHQDYRQKPSQAKETKHRKNSFTSEASRQCRTEINQFKALKAKINAEKQLVEQEIKYQNKTIQTKKRRELKESTTFVIRNPKDKDQSFEGSERKKKPSTKQFMIAPHQLVSGRKMQEKDQSRAESRQIQLDLQKKEKAPIKYKTIEPKITKIQQSGLLSGGNTVKMSTNSKDRYNQNFQNTKSKQKSFIITSRKPFSSSSKQHRDSLLSGVRENDDKDKLNPKSEIDKLSTKLKQMQEKLLLVQRKQKQLEQFQLEKQKKFEKSRQKSYANSKVTSKRNEILTEKEIKNQEKLQKDSSRKGQIKKSIKPTEERLEKQEKIQQFNLIEEISRKQKKLKRLNISSEIIAYNYKQDLQNQIKQEEQVNIKEKMSQEIGELKKIIKQLKIDKIKQQAKIQDLEQKDQNKKFNNFIETNNSQITFNGEESKAASSIRQNYFAAKQSELSEDQLEVEERHNPEKNKYFVKKQPRRILKMETNQKPKINKLESPISAPSKHTNSSLNSSTVKNMNQLSFNPQDQRSEMNSIRKKGIIIRQIINQEKFNTIDDKSQQSAQNGSKQQKSQQNLESKQSEPYLMGIVHEIDFQQFQKPEINAPQIQILQPFPIPDLPSTPLLETSQSEILILAKKICEIFQIKIDGKEQLQFKKFKNCVVLKTHENNQAIVWHFSGKFYIGGWDQNSSSGQDHKNGEGFEFVPGKHYYRGQFLNGKRNRQGTMVMLDGDIYKGEWVNGQKNGQGIYFEKKINSYYQGEFKEGKKTGLGIFKTSEKEFYQGQFQKSVKTGSGLQLFSNGDLYIGQYKNGKFNGKGKYFWSNGSAYIGEFVEGNREGEGKWISSINDGDLYVGSYKKDKKEGKGKYIWNKGCVFEGEFKADLKHGEGRVQYQDGREVKGLWEYGKLKTIYKSELEGQSNIQSQASLQIQPRIRPNMPRIIETPSKQMQESKFIHGV